MATKQELQKKYANCKFAPKSIDEQKEIIQKLHELGFKSTTNWYNEEVRCIYTYSDRGYYITYSEVESMADLNYFVNHKNILIDANDLLNEKIALTINDLDLISIKGKNKNVIIFDSIYDYIKDYSKDFSTFMQAGEALAAALDVNVLFSVKNELNPGIGWSKQSYNQDINPWINFLNDSSECIEDTVINLIENYPIKQKIEIYL